MNLIGVKVTTGSVYSHVEPVFTLPNIIQIVTAIVSRGKFYVIYRRLTASRTSLTGYVVQSMSNPESSAVKVGFDERHFPQCSCM